ncbi:MAG: malate dehydrogenase [Pseudomonadota bacterium]|nr:malate dehydrogenase [Pseudomonadota bacterium]
MSGSSRVLTITITGAAGQIGYALLPRLGELLFDVDTKIVLKLHDLDVCMPALKAVAMELEDCAFSWIDKIVVTSNLKEAFDGCQMAVLIGAKPRQKGMERAELLKQNGLIFKEQGAALNQYADKNIQVLVVGNPCNTNAYVCLNHARDIPSHRFYSMSMLDQNRAYSFLAKQYDLDIAMIENLCIWGNHSPTMYTDYERALYNGKPILEYIQDRQWLANDLQEKVANRGSEVIAARGASSSASAANAIIDSLIVLVDSEQGYGSFSMGVYSNGEYGAQPGTIVSYPCHYDSKGRLRVVPNISLDAATQKRIAHSFAEISNEAALCRDLDLIINDH